MRRFIKIKREKKEIGRGKNIRTVTVVYPEFLTTGKDIMRRGGRFYAILDPKTGMWSRDEADVYRIIDEELYSYADSHFKINSDGEYYTDDPEEKVIIKTIEESTSKMLIEFNKWFNNLAADLNYKPLDSDLTFLSDEVTPDMFRSKRLPYDLADGDISAYTQIVDTLYSPNDKRKIEWAIGAVLSGDSKKIEKFIVLYGKRGTGKSTILDLIEKIFEGYWSVFVAEELALKSHQFATAAFKDNPLVAIQDDGSLAKIDSPRINEIVSHRTTQINEKNTKQYSLRPQAMLFMATNDLIDIHDTTLGITRRLIDVYPTGNLIGVREYRRLVKQMMTFEIAAIAKHCLDVYEELGKEYYAKYEPVQMIKKTNYLQNFMFEKAEELKEMDPIKRTTIYNMFRAYCESMGLSYPQKGNVFGEQVKEFYNQYFDVKWIDGRAQRYLYSGFKYDMFLEDYTVKKEEPKDEDVDTDDGWLKLDSESTVFDDWCKDKGFKAQYGVPNKTGDLVPIIKWDKVKTTMEDIDRSKLHYIQIPVEEEYIRIDFDLKDKDGNKSLERNIKAANEYPPTYAEISKSGGGIHLYYIYDGDQSELAQYESKDVEIKTTVGKSPIRRKFTKCNDLPVATLHHGDLELKERKKMLPVKELQNAKHLENKIKQHLRKDVFPSTVQSVRAIKEILDDAYDKDKVSYDVSWMENDIYWFAVNSTHHKDECSDLVDRMHFKSKDNEIEQSEIDTPLGGEVNDNKPIAFFDVEVFPNVFILCWKYAGEKASVTKLINPNPEHIESLFKNCRMIGFNNRDYDNHICWYYMKSPIPYLCYDVSHKIINGTKEVANAAKDWHAYSLSYTDVYDFASNPNKMSLKKWEIKLGIHHQENSYPWDEDLPKDKWDEVADYCANDVIATEKVFNHIQGDFMARLILAKLSGLTPNDKTNKHSEQIIFGDDKNPQSQFIYTDLSKLFPGYKFDKTAKVKSTYKGYEVGEGGFVWSKPGMYRHVVTFDVASMHPSSLIAMNMFGDKYTKRFKELKDARLAIKHEDREALTKLLDGQLLEFYDVGIMGEQFTLKDLSTALKTVINSVYGLTAASFPNRCKDPLNVDNIVAKRGALFMVNLLEKVTKEWDGEVIHIKTDSIKVVNPSDELAEKIISYGKEFGYDFEVESRYDRICLIDKAQYIAKEDDHWEPKGDTFLHPYVFKKLFSHEPITIDDMSETHNANKGALYLDFNENLGEDEHNYLFVGKVSAFIPIKPGRGGGELKVLRDGKYSYASGATGWRWLETEYFKVAYTDRVIDMRYYEKLIDDVIETMSQFGDPDRFINDPDYDPQLEKLIAVPEGVDEEVPFDEDKPFMNKPE